MNKQELNIKMNIISGSLEMIESALKKRSEALEQAASYNKSEHDLVSQSNNDEFVHFISSLQRFKNQKISETNEAVKYIKTQQRSFDEIYAEYRSDSFDVEKASKYCDQLAKNIHSNIIIQFINLSELVSQIEYYLNQIDNSLLQNKIYGMLDESINSLRLAHRYNQSLDALSSVVIGVKLQEVS